MTHDAKDVRPKNQSCAPLPPPPPPTKAESRKPNPSVVVVVVVLNGFSSSSFQKSPMRNEGLTFWYWFFSGEFFVPFSSYPWHYDHYDHSYWNKGLARQIGSTEWDGIHHPY